jgi:protein required for attachment to host cells
MPRASQAVRAVPLRVRCVTLDATERQEVTMANGHWILVANGSRAVCYSRNPRKSDWTLAREAEFEHAESRMKGSELVADRPGGVRGHGNDSTKLVPRTDPRRNEVEQFARELAAHLDGALKAGRYGKLTLVASNPFLGMLVAQLPAGVRRSIDAQLAHDYTQLAPKELQARLKEHLGTPK